MAFRVVIAEDHELTRLGLVHVLKKNDKIEIVDEAVNGEEAIALVAKLKPDIVLMDIGMPVMDGITATQKIKASYPNVKVAILTSHKEEKEVLASLAAGADAYCSKDISADRLIQVLEMVIDGVIWLDPNIASVVMNTLLKKTPEPAVKVETKSRQRYNTDLTQRELEVLSYIVEGKANKEIAESMNLSVYTVKAHVCSIIQKLSVDDRTQAAVKALKTGLVGS